jgi:hypothetical protein
MERNRRLAIAGLGKDKHMNRKPCILAARIAALFLPALLGACADMFQGKIPMPEVRGTGSLDDLLVVAVTPEITELSPPAQVVVEDRQSATRIKVSWSAVKGAIYYQLDRAVVEQGLDGAYPEPREEDFEFLSKVYGVSYLDYLLSDPQRDSPEYKQRFYYRLSSGSADLEPAGTSDPLWGSLLPPVPGVRATLGTREGMVELSWTLVDKAAAYEIYRADSETSAMEYRGRRLGGQDMFQNKITGTDEGKEFYYWVYALADSGEKSIPSNAAMGYSQIAGSPSMPENPGLKAGYSLGSSTTEIKLAWGASSAAGEVKYVVFRYNQNDDTLVRLTPRPAGVLEGTVNTYWDDNIGLEPGIYYYYLIQAVTLDGSRTLKSGMDRSLAFRAFVLSPPSSAEAIKASPFTTLRWKAAINDDLAPIPYDYRIEGAPASTGPWTTVDTLYNPPAGGDGIITKTGVPPYPFYRIITVNGGAESDPGAVFAPSPDAAVMTDVSQARYLDGSGPNGEGVYPVAVSWQKPDADTPAAYRVYRSENRDAGFRAIGADIPASAGPGGQFTFVDQNSSARPGKYYYYRVLSLNELGQGSFYSETRVGYGILTPERFFAEFIRTANNSLNKLVNMNKPGATDKLGDEKKDGTVSGTVAYDSPDSVLSAIPPFTIYLTYANYADYYIESNSALGPYVILNGNSDTRVTSTSGNGQMQGTITVGGMYGGTVNYDNITITSQVAGGGYYLVQPAGFPSAAQVDWTKGKR